MSNTTQFVINFDGDEHTRPAFREELSEWDEAEVVDELSSTFEPLSTEAEDVDVVCQHCGNVCRVSECEATADITTDVSIDDDDVVKSVERQYLCSSSCVQRFVMSTLMGDA